MIGVIVVLGTVVSTTKAREAGEGSGLPAGSVARTSNVWRSCAERRGVKGEPQDGEGPVVDAALERRAGLGREGEGRRGVVVGPVGPSVIVVSGGVRSTLVGAGVARGSLRAGHAALVGGPRAAGRDVDRRAVRGDREHGRLRSVQRGGEQRVGVLVTGEPAVGRALEVAAVVDRGARERAVGGDWIVRGR